MKLRLLMTSLKLLVGVSFLCVSLRGQAISHVSRGKVQSSSSYYSVLLPDSISIYPLSLNSVVLRNPLASGGADGEWNTHLEQVYVFEPLLVMPDLGDFSELEVSSELEARGWNFESHLGCIYYFTSELEGTHSHLLTWGRGRGAFLVESGAPITREIVEFFIERIHLEQGACAWNP